MKKISALLIFYQLFATQAFAQFYIEPLVGYQVDLNNERKFKQFNTGIQLAWKAHPVYEWVFKIQRSWPVSYNSNDSSFSANPALPLYSAAKKTIAPSTWSFAPGMRLKLAGKNSKNILFAIGYIGMAYQKIEVNYHYDKGNYIILNPDQTQERFRAFFSGGFEYMHLLEKGRLFLQVSASTPPFGVSISYPSSFGFMAPLSINAGYSILLSKK